jgi:hypothetical protein
MTVSPCRGPAPYPTQLALAHGNAQPLATGMLDYFPMGIQGVATRQSQRVETCGTDGIRTTLPFGQPRGDQYKRLLIQILETHRRAFQHALELTSGASQIRVEVQRRVPARWIPATAGALGIARTQRIRPTNTRHPKPDSPIG